MDEPESPKPPTSPWRWALVAAVIILTGYSIYAAGGLTQRMNTTSAAVPSRQLPSTPDGVVCAVPADIPLGERVDVRIQSVRGEGLRIARRTTATVDEEGLHLPATTPFGTATISLGNAEYATFEFTEGGCSTITRRPPEPEPTAP